MQASACAQVDNDFHYKQLCFGSDYIERGVLSLLQRQQQWSQMCDIVSITAGMRHASTLRWAVFERIVHRLMAVGGKFEVRSLTAPSEPAFEVELPRSKTAVFRRLEDVVTPAAGTYYTPSAPRSSPPSSVDGILSAVVPVKGDR